MLLVVNFNKAVSSRGAKHQQKFYDSRGLKDTPPLVIDELCQEFLRDEEIFEDGMMQTSDTECTMPILMRSNLGRSNEYTKFTHDMWSCKNIKQEVDVIVELLGNKVDIEKEPAMKNQKDISPVV
ncbi:hypothetical protein RCL_jg17942.t1 [Rhizophagus clarus]|uniref:Uncharacterized protein n=1 Tax=Rhizophagus clarus TaxID=94130 RepID=A0A8H3L711_9GLOM|nr:hypothetical protein RCL_jg17942.t1 [Rhizophagus clarus]